MTSTEKIALVAGASRPIGRGIARMLQQEGFTLVLPFFDDWPKDTESLCAEFSAVGSRHLVVPCDLRNREHVAALAHEIEKNFGELHVLVNNIERGGMPVVHGSYDLEVNREQWDLEIATTLTAKQALFSSTLPLLKKAKGASVVTITSIAGIVGRSGPASLLFSDGYAAANRAISSLTETWARMGAPDVRVNELMVGIMAHRHGEGTKGWSLLTDAQKKALTDHILLGRSGAVQEIVDAVRFLALTGGYITGAVLRLDGGYVLGGEKAAMPPGVMAGETERRNK